jgi:hypothetical protein
MIASWEGRSICGELEAARELSKINAAFRFRTDLLEDFTQYQRDGAA